VHVILPGSGCNYGEDTLGRTCTEPGLFGSRMSLESDPMLLDLLHYRYNLSTVRYLLYRYRALRYDYFHSVFIPSYLGFILRLNTGNVAEE